MVDFEEDKNELAEELEVIASDISKYANHLGSREYSRELKEIWVKLTKCRNNLDFVLKRLAQL